MKKYIAIAAAVMACAACSKNKNNDPAAAATQVALNKDLQNTFVDDTCKVDFKGTLESWAATGFDFAAAIKSTRTEFQFQGATVTRRQIYYSETGCKEELYRFVENGEFKLESDSSKKTNDGGRLVDFHFKNVQVQANSDKGVEVVNKMKLCDKADYGKTEVDVSGVSAKATCYGASEPREQYNVYKLDNKVLQLGADDTKPNTAETRPQALLSEKYSQK